MQKFHLELSEPTVVVRGDVGDQAWGHYQFPDLRRAENGGLLAYWAYGADTIEYQTHENDKKPPYISMDGGQSWAPNRENVPPQPKWVMPDGKHFLGFESLGAKPMPEEWWNQHTVAHHWKRWGMDFHVYFLEDFEKDEYTTVQAKIYDPATGETETYAPVINWPNHPFTRHHGGKIYPATTVFALCNCGILQKDGVLYTCLYTYGLDSTAPTREEAVKRVNLYNRYCCIYVFSSEDCARTWNFVSQLPVTDATFREGGTFEGHDEPMMETMPDGSVVMLFRTGSDQPSYLVRSTDNCKTWSEPQKFDDIGVLPQILTLKCGVTLASYGRPILKIRASGDPAGLIWQEPTVIPLTDADDPTVRFKQNVSCFYTKFLPLSDHSALWCYTEFLRPNENGEPAKTVLTRIVTVVED